jgi:hypothetical protein
MEVNKRKETIKKKSGFDKFVKRTRKELKERGKIQITFYFSACNQKTLTI